MALEQPPSQYYQQVIDPQVQSTATIALVLEIVFGYFGGTLGLGNIYAKRIVLGLAFMIGYWVFLAISVVLILVTVGLAAICLVPVFIAAPIVSGVVVRQHVITNNVKSDTSNLLLAIGIGVGVLALACVGVLVFFLVLGGSLAALEEFSSVLRLLS